MTTVLRYGHDGEMRVDLANDALLADCDAPRGEALADPAAATVAAIMRPIEFPPLSMATVPGDRVVIALDAGVPSGAEIVAAVVDGLVERGAEPADIVVILPASNQTTEDPRSEIHVTWRHEVRLIRHDPAQKNELGYLGAATEGQPIYLNRALLDADLIVPIGCLRLNASLGYHGVHDAIFPAFSDQETQDRYRLADVSQSQAEQDRRRHESDEVAWLLGVLFTIQVVPGRGESVLHVLAGEPRAVFKRGSQLCEEAWSYSAPCRASLVVATIEGDSKQQTWENVARALAAASRVVAEDGAIALCTDLEIPPGPALRRLAAAEDKDRALRKIRKQHVADLLPATQLAQTLDRAKVYLLSRLDEETVEDLGVAPVAAAEEIARLAGRHASCILLANAQHALVTPVVD